MSSLAISGEDAPNGDRVGRNYIEVIHNLMADKDTAQRSLAKKAGISKTRLALLLHKNPEKRSRLTVEELDRILHALGTNIVDALMRADALQGLDPSDRERYQSVVDFVCEFVVGLGKKIIEALDGIDGVDGSEVRKEWAIVLQKGIVEDISKAVAKMMERRALIAERDDLWR